MRPILVIHRGHFVTVFVHVHFLVEVVVGLLTAHMCYLCYNVCIVVYANRYPSCWEGELQRVIHMLLFWFLLLHLHCCCCCLILFFLFSSLGEFLFTLCQFLFHDASPVSVDVFGDPCFDLYSRHTLHSEDLQGHIVTTNVGVRHTLDHLVVLTARMLRHGVDR